LRHVSHRAFSFDSARFGHPAFAFAHGFGVAFGFGCFGDGRTFFVQSSRQPAKVVIGVFSDARRNGSVLGPTTSLPSSSYSASSSAWSLSKKSSSPSHP
jgi:hypothetical protein